MQSPSPLVSAGHVGHFTPPSEDSIYYRGDFFSTRAEPHPGEIKFSGLLHIPPFVKFLIHANGSFTIFGPFFSVLHECAAKMNWSLVGDYPKMADQKEFWSFLMLFRPDVGLFPYFPVSQTVIEAAELGIVKFGRVAGMFEMDHIMSRVRYHRPNLLAMLTPFDFTSLMFLFGSLLLVSLYASRFFKRNTDGPFWKSFLWHLTTALIEPPEVTTPRPQWRIIALTWLVGVDLIQKLFSGDMYTAMTLPPSLDVVESWADLAKTKGPIMVFCGLEDKVDNYLNADNPYEKQLARRIKKLPLEYMYNSTLVSEVMKNVSTGTQYLVTAKHVMQQFQSQLQTDVSPHDTYISEEYGQHMPYFMVTNYYADSLIYKAFNKMMGQLDENGIYNKWVSVYTANAEVAKRELVEFENTKLKNFRGLFTICTFFFTIAILIFVCEKSALRKKDEKESETSSQLFQRLAPKVEMELKAEAKSDSELEIEDFDKEIQKLFIFPGTSKTFSKSSENKIEERQPIEPVVQESNSRNNESSEASKLKTHLHVSEPKDSIESEKLFQKVVIYRKSIADSQNQTKIVAKRTPITSCEKKLDDCDIESHQVIPPRGHVHKP